jgi:uncharacterized membrane protein
MRYQSIDALRTIAILIMVAVHFSENLSGRSPSRAWARRCSWSSLA